MDRIEELWNEFIPLVAAYVPKVLLAILTLIIGLWVIKGITRLFKRRMEKREVDESMRDFLASLVSILLKVTLVISIASMVGVETASFVGVLAAASLAVGLALQGSLANFAGGVLILTFKPYKVGDVIETQGVIGKVDSIQIFNTIMMTPENRTAIIPNGPISNDKVINFTKSGVLRTDIPVGISYDANIKEAKDIIMKLVEADDRILDDPAPAVVVTSLGDNSVNLSVRVYGKSDDTWPIFFDHIEEIKVALDKAGIGIPYPQRDIHVHGLDLGKVS